MAGRHETVGGGDDLALGDTQRLQCRNQRQGAVGKEGDILHPQILRQCTLQLLVVVAIVGNPLAIPDILEQGVVLLQVGEEGGGDGYDFIVVHIHFVRAYLIRT